MSIGYFERPSKLKDSPKPHNAKWLLWQRMIHDPELVFPKNMKAEVEGLIKEFEDRYKKKPRARIIFK